MLRVVRAEGRPEDRGRTIGHELGDLIHRSLGFYRRLLAARGIDARALAASLAPYRDAAVALPEQVSLLEGMAAGAEASLDELWFVNGFEELEPAE